MASDGILVFDLGTSSLKAALVDTAGRIAKPAESAYGDSPGAHRQDSAAWWDAAQSAVRAMGPIRPRAIVFCGTMENLIPVTADGAAVGPAILYSDPCGEDALERKRGALAAIGAAALLGNAPEPLMTAFKILWLAGRQPEVLDQARWLLLSPKDVLILQMTGRAVTDPTTASTSGLMDMARRRWSAPLAAALGVDLDKLPEILPANAVAGPLLPAAAGALGLPAGVPVINGSGDAGASTLGAGCTHVGDVSVYLGTTGWVARVVAATGLAEVSGCYRLAHPEPGRIIEISPLLAAGGCAAWARKTLGLELEAAETAAQEADRSPPDLLFLPYLSGERAPFLDLDVRGAYLGLDAGHGAGELYYAALEGVAFAVAANLAALRGADDSGAVRLSGGGARSQLWAQLIADATGSKVASTLEPEFLTALGAARLAQAANKVLDPVGTQIAPRPERTARIARLRSLFKDATRFARESAGRLSAD